MLNQFFKQITSALESQTGEQAVKSEDIERVSAVLLVEIARSDHDISDTERAAILSALTESSSLPSSELEALVEDAFQDADNTLSLHEHVRLINENFEKAKKLLLIEQMWRVAFADGNVDSYEEYTIRKLCDLLHIKHRDYMQAKLKVAG